MIEKDFELYYDLGEKLREIRLSKNLSLADVADKLHVAAKTLQRYECGERKIKLDILLKLTEIYDIDYYQFVKNIRLGSVIRDYDISFVSKDGALLLAETSPYETKEPTYENLHDLISKSVTTLNNEQKIELIKLLSQ